MLKAVINYKSKKIAFLTFKIVEQSIKSACLKVHVQKLMPVKPNTINEIRTRLTKSKVFRGEMNGKLLQKRANKNKD